MVQHDIGLFFEPSHSKGLNPLRFPFWTIQNLPLSNYSWIRWWFLHILYLIFVKDLHGVQWKEICMELYGKSAYVLVLVCCCLEQKVHPWMRTRFQSATSTRSSQFKSCESTKARWYENVWGGDSWKKYAGNTNLFLRDWVHGAERWQSTAPVKWIICES